MTLTQFIRKQSETILAGWTQQFENILPSHGLTRDEVRDHARELLELVVEEMETNHSIIDATNDTSARRHGVQRQTLGVNLLHLAAEFRALRFDVVRFWIREKDRFSKSDFDQMLRFNQILDDVLGESIDGFTKERNRQHRLFETLLDSMPDPTYVLDLKGRLTYANTAITEELHNISIPALVEKSLADLHVHGRSDFVQGMLDVIKDRKRVTGEVTVSTLENEKRFYEYVYAPVLDENENVESIVGAARDITDRKHAEMQAWHQATNDHLTGVPNLKLFQDRLDEQAKGSKRTGMPFALLLIDLDQFKEINDSLGHDAGDLLLVNAARRITDCIRETDTVARLGGDEFAVILQDVEDKPQIEQIANAILAELARPFDLMGNRVVISGSIGIAIFPRDADQMQALQKSADQAMYRAKHGGRNQLHFSSHAVRTKALMRLELVEALRTAREQNELQLHYQPIINLVNGRIAGAEALLRWDNPEKGLLMPADFIELAEETGLIQELENWVLDEAAASAEHWGNLSGAPFRININKSPLQFIRPESRQSWKQPLDKLNLADRRISIEFPEEVLMNASNELATQLADFRSAGIMLTLDHFGISGSPMAGLERFSIDTLKIDRSFLPDITSNTGNQKSVKAIVVMAHTLGLDVIAEGVETREQRDWLQAAGCDFAQGFFFAEPLSPHAFTEAISTAF